jgi:hypothetical protein
MGYSSNIYVLSIIQVAGIFHHLVERALGAGITTRAKPVGDITAQHVEALSLILQHLHCILIGHWHYFDSLSFHDAPPFIWAG